MTVYAIAQSRITDPQQMQVYIEAATPTLDPYGGRLLALDEAPQVIEGEITTPRTVIVCFDSADEFHTWYRSPEYQAAKRLREHALVGTFILVAGL